MQIPSQGSSISFYIGNINISSSPYSSPQSFSMN